MNHSGQSNYNASNQQQQQQQAWQNGQDEADKDGFIHVEDYANDGQEQQPPPDKSVASHTAGWSKSSFKFWKKEQPLVVRIIPLPVFELFKRMKQKPPTSRRVAQATRLKVLKSTRVRPQGLVASLRQFAHSCQNEQMRAKVNEIIWRLDNPNKHEPALSEVFTCSSGDKKSPLFEFMCLAVRVYKIDKVQEACDFALSTYSQKEIPVEVTEYCANRATSAQINYPSYSQPSSAQQQSQVDEVIQARFLVELTDGGYATLDQQGGLFIVPDQ